ncbi:MAG: hypothetical protein KF905_10265 [Flavobacteriales bacterium]|nr:hypothetical protein [Flavobacteriales bacterium]
MNNNILSDRATRLFLVLGGFFVANALISEMIGVKLFQLEHVFGLAKADITLLGQRELSSVSFRSNRAAPHFTPGINPSRSSQG